MTAQLKVGSDTPVGAALSRIASRYDVAIEEMMTFEIDPCAFNGGETLVALHRSETFGLVWLEASDFEALALAREAESIF